MTAAMTTLGTQSAAEESSLIDALLSGTLSRPFDCYSADLKGQNFQGLDLSQGRFARADLSGANLSGTNLSKADLRGVDLSGANLSGANLSGACLYRADLSGANLAEADLTDTQLEIARYDSHTIFPEGFGHRSCGAIGPHANLNGAPLNTANLRNADLQGARMLGAYLTGADLTGANLKGARLTNADLRKAFLTGACLRDAGLNNANLAQVDLRAADLTGAEFDELEAFAGADFSLVQGLSDRQRAYLLNHNDTILDTWNSFTRQTTRDSLAMDL